mgnify:CR=1 FL=1
MIRNIVSLSLSIWRVFKLRLQGIKIKTGVRIGKAVTIKSGEIESGVRIMPTSKIDIGKNFYVNCYSHLCGSIFIGDDVQLGPKVVIWSKNHVFSSLDIPINKQGHTDEPIIIGNNVWIGASAVILPGVSVGEGSVVGAGSIVAKDIPPYSIAVGNPAKVIRSRK